MVLGRGNGKGTGKAPGFSMAFRGGGRGRFGLVPWGTSYPTFCSSRLDSIRLDLRLGPFVEDGRMNRLIGPSCRCFTRSTVFPPLDGPSCFVTYKISLVGHFPPWVRYITTHGSHSSRQGLVLRPNLPRTFWGRCGLTLST